MVAFAEPKTSSKPQKKSKSRSGSHSRSFKTPYPRSKYVRTGLRFYSANLHTWPNRDPICEKGGLNIYAFISNKPTMAVDPLGKAHFCCPSELAQVYKQYNDCVTAANNSYDTCVRNAQTVRDVSLTANETTYETAYASATAVGDSCRSGCNTQFPNQEFGRNSCIHLCDAAEGVAKDVLYAAYALQRGLIYEEYAGLYLGCGVVKTTDINACENAGKAQCTNF